MPLHNICTRRVASDPIATKLLQNRQTRHFGVTAADTLSVLDVAAMLAERDAMLSTMRQNLLSGQQQMKLQADKHHSKHTLDVGDFVYLKLQQYVQSSLVPHTHRKLSFKYFDPLENHLQYQLCRLQARAATKLCDPSNFPRVAAQAGVIDKVHHRSC